MILRSLAIVSLAVIGNGVVLGASLNVNAQADLYSAGHASVPNTANPGIVAPGFSFQAQANQVLTFSSVTGMVGCNYSITNGADGTCVAGVDTTVTSYGGISGITVTGMNMFLTGVFLDGSEPVGAGPSVLVYNSTQPGSLNTSDLSFSPALDQAFFIGDGLTGTGAGQTQQFVVPMTASRLYLGFADSFDSAPSYYDDNVGSLNATFSFTQSVPEPKAWVTLAAGLLAMGIFRTRK